MMYYPISALHASQSAAADLANVQGFHTSAFDKSGDIVCHDFVVGCWGLWRSRKGKWCYGVTQWRDT